MSGGSLVGCSRLSKKLNTAIDLGQAEFHSAATDRLQRWK
jgi:hypothetical protein